MDQTFAYMQLCTCSLTDRNKFSAEVFENLSLGNNEKRCYIFVFMYLLFEFCETLAIFQIIKFTGSNENTQMLHKYAVNVCILDVKLNFITVK